MAQGPIRPLGWPVMNTWALSPMLPPRLLALRPSVKVTVPPTLWVSEARVTVAPPLLGTIVKREAPLFRVTAPREIEPCTPLRAL